MDTPLSLAAATQSLIVPEAVALQVTAEQFEAIALANPDLRLERTATG